LNKQVFKLNMEIKMKNIVSVLTVTAILFFVTLNSVIYCQSSKKYDYKDFNSVSVGWGMHIKVTQSSSYFIEIKGDEADLKVIKVEKSGDEVKFYVPRNNYRMHDEVNITVNLPELTELGLSGGSEGDISMDIKSKPFKSHLSGGSRLSKGTLNCGNSEFELSGGSYIKLNGKCGDLNISGSGGSIFELKDFAAKDVECSLSGGSQAKVKMDGTLNTEQSGGSMLTYYGNAKIRHTDFSGGSGIEQAD
jgi:hypothetical protein